MPSVVTILSEFINTLIATCFISALIVSCDLVSVEQFQVRSISALLLFPN